MTPAPQYASVAVPVPVRSLYTYALPEALAPEAAIGKRVLVPFRSRRVTGYILGFKAKSDLTKIKPVIDLLDEQPLFTPEKSAFFQWVADYYFYPIGQVIEAALPTGINIQDQKKYALTKAGQKALLQRSVNKTQLRILKRLQKAPATARQMRRETAVTAISRNLRALEQKGLLAANRQLSRAAVAVKTERMIRWSGKRPKRMTAQRETFLQKLDQHGEQPLSALKKGLPTVAGIIAPLIKEGVVTDRLQSVYRDPFGDAVLPDAPLNPTVDQKRVIAEVLSKLGVGYHAFVLEGVTGSGKTEVYLQLAEAALKRRMTVLVLVPEIALISQMVRRFQARFGGQVAMLHSGLSAGERYDQWRRIIDANIPLVIGARSAVFAPLKAPGLIVVDEEHDESYKQDFGLRYNARDLAVIRAQMANGIVLLGSATPSLQSLYNVRKGKFTLLYMPRRIKERPLPHIHTLDLRYEKRDAPSSRYLTQKLISAITVRLQKKEQVLLFLNRRGFAGYPLCVACGQPLTCRHCDVTLTLHRARHAFVCHYCGYTRAAAATCAVCGQKAIQALGLGTEQLEQLIQKRFPRARVARLDRDTTSRKGALVKILHNLRNRKIDILVGTQMITKGHDFPGITLVGIISADQSLNLPDFRAGERTFQMLIQVAGRTGRGDAGGEVMLQTFNPEHYTIQAARTQSSKAFYGKEIQFRKTLFYPPFSRMALILTTDADRKNAESGINRLFEKAQTLQQKISEYQSLVLLGPVEAPLFRISRRFRYQLLVKAPSVKLREQFLKAWLYDSKSSPLMDSAVRIQVDVDPYSML